MSKWRFKQIRSVLRPEIGYSSVGDKCHQLCWVINHFNRKSRKSFIPGFKMSFDEGGHATRSRFCPCRQYNKDKPNKFRVDFFILCDAHQYFISHIDVYQGKNGANIGIHPDCIHMPTTQKAVANAILCSGISNDPNGYREVYTDNRYSSVELALFLREHCNF